MLLRNVYHNCSNKIGLVLKKIYNVRYKDYIDDDYSEISDDELYQKSKRDRRRNYRKMDDDSSINTNNVVRRKESRVCLCFMVLIMFLEKRKN